MQTVFTCVNSISSNVNVLIYEKGTATARPGRWRSFPYLAELEGAEGDALWKYLCWEWDRDNDIQHNPGRQLVKFNFFMLQADVLPVMSFSATRKRLIKTVDCVSSSNLDLTSDRPLASSDEL